VVDLGALDAILRREVHDRFDHRNINLDVPEFADGKLVPSGENLARFICERVSEAMRTDGMTARVTTVSISEDPSLRATYAV